MRNIGMAGVIYGVSKLPLMLNISCGYCFIMLLKQMNIFITWTWGPKHCVHFAIWTPRLRSIYFFTFISLKRFGIYTCSVVGKPINFFDGVSSGIWLNQESTGNVCFIQSVIASTVWFIWKARCNKIFNNEQMDCRKVSNMAIGHVREYFFAPPPHMGRNFILNNFTFADSPIMLIVVVFNADLFTAGLGFMVSDFKSNMP